MILRRDVTSEVRYLTFTNASADLMEMMLRKRKRKVILWRILMAGASIHATYLIAQMHLFQDTILLLHIS